MTSSRKRQNSSAFVNQQGPLLHPCVVALIAESRLSTDTPVSPSVGAALHVAALAEASEALAQRLLVCGLFTRSDSPSSLTSPWSCREREEAVEEGDAEPPLRRGGGRDSTNRINEQVNDSCSSKSNNSSNINTQICHDYELEEEEKEEEEEEEEVVARGGTRGGERGGTAPILYDFVDSSGAVVRAVSLGRSSGGGGGGGLGGRSAAAGGGGPGGAGGRRRGGGPRSRGVMMTMTTTTTTTPVAGVEGAQTRMTATSASTSASPTASGSGSESGSVDGRDVRRAAVAWSSSYRSGCGSLARERLLTPSRSGSANSHASSSCSPSDMASSSTASSGSRSTTNSEAESESEPESSCGASETEKSDHSEGLGARATTTTMTKRKKTKRANCCHNPNHCSNTVVKAEGNEVCDSDEPHGDGEPHSEGAEGTTTNLLLALDEVEAVLDLASREVVEVLPRGSAAQAGMNATKRSRYHFDSADFVLESLNLRERLVGLRSGHGASTHGGLPVIGEGGKSTVAKGNHGGRGRRTRRSATAS